MNENFLPRCKVKGKGSERVPISHLLFFDNINVFYEASQDQMVFLMWLHRMLFLSRCKVMGKGSEEVPISL